MAVDQHEVIELLDSDEDDIQVDNNNRNGDEDVEEVQVERAVRNAAPVRGDDDDDEDLVVTGAFSRNMAPHKLFVFLPPTSPHPSSSSPS